VSVDERDEQIVQLIAGCQDRLYAYVLTLVPDRTAAGDILQETNLVLWRRRQGFTIGTSFTAWAYKTAFMQVLAHRRDRGRDRHVFFSEELMGQLAGEAQRDAEEIPGRQAALRGCLAKLSDRQRWLIAQRYSSGNSIKVIAEMTGKTIGAITTTVYRIRNALRECITRTLAAEDAP